MRKQHSSPSQPLTKADLVEVIGGLEERLEVKIDSKVDTLARAVNTGFNDVYLRLDVLTDQERRHYLELKQDVGRVGIRLERLQETTDNNTLEIGKLQGRTTTMERELGVATEKI